MLPSPPHPTRLAACQPHSSTQRIVARCEGDPVARNQHFLRHNIGAASYDADYCRSVANEYLTYLDGWAEQAADDRVQLLLLPEFLLMPGVLGSPAEGVNKNPTGYADAVALYAWSGQLFQEWAFDWSKRTGMLIAAALPMVRDGRIYNTGLLVDGQTNLVDRYEKVHLPPGEVDVFDNGSCYRVADTRLGRVAFSVCYDIQFPEMVACLAAENVDIILHPSGGYSLPDESFDMGEARLRVRASDCWAAVVYASFAPKVDRSPCQSCVIAPNGDVLARVEGRTPDAVGIAAANVTVGSKRQWPGDNDQAPDRQLARRGYRQPATYAPLMQP